MSSAREFAQKAYDTLSEALADLSSLTIETHTIDPGGKSMLRARTEISMDGDTKVHLPVDGEDRINEALLKQHQRAIEQARGERQVLWDQVMTVVRGAIEVEKVEVEQEG